ncbi:MAG: ribonuclease III [Proteobacteria bacterium]|nr:ribonuclease III [Pseudomonadota bacterium]
MSTGLRKLQARLGYLFDDSRYLEMALTHRSAHKNNNERLEFLGDAVLGLVIARALFERFPDAREGKLTRMRARLVRGDTLSEIAEEIEVQTHLILGEGELKAGGRQRSSIRADALEAIFGAIYLDADSQKVREVILKLYESRLAEANPDIEKDPKTLLQEAVQKQGKALPEYQILSKSGQAHDLEFMVECRLRDMDIAETAKGKSRRNAEQTAAQRMLAKINQI